ncbi:Semaphorin-5A [Desmophyllum pertusum]|uniref:Semaphorin-5A n=1 Tax=Desmophyllum pertusum TaxID=174260 RepID=A0A9X0DCP1_9CNID|nr:Semaphorin-5A [Desmophyllum pertusum]
MNANELPVVPLEEMDILEITETPDFVVEIPSQMQPVENNGVENIKISFIDKSKPVQAVNEVSLSPSPEGNLENIKISFLGNKTSPAVSAAGNVISLQPTVAEREHQSIRISFENEKENVAPTSAPLVHETANHITVQNLTVSLPSSVEHVLATPAPPMPTGPGVVNPFEGGIVDQIIRNATAVPMPSIEHVLATPAPPMPRGPGVVNPFEGDVVDVPAVPLSPNQNITVDFRHNTETGVPVVQQPHVTMQQHPVVEQNATNVPNVYETWCNDDPVCAKYTETNCNEDWLKVNCPKKCKICGNATASEVMAPQQVSNQTTNKETGKHYTELTVTVPSEVTKSLETSRNPVLVNIKGENGKPALADEETNKAPMVETIVVKLPANIKAEDENATQVKINGPAKNHINVSMNHGTTILEMIPEAPWCNDKSECSRYSRNQCNDEWVQLNCHENASSADVTVCKDNAECSRYSTESCENEWMKNKLNRNSGKGETEGACASKDHVDCNDYPMYACHNDWLIKNCKRKCGLCKAPTQAPVGLVAPTSPPLQANNATVVRPPGHAQCYYDGIAHEHGERWSPGPCTPECKCDDGKIRCTLIECPELNCKNPIKKRWKCCPECPVEQGLNARCVETEGGSSNGACCVFPYIYHGTQYFECTDDEHQKPWCATTSNYDIDGMWGHCLGDTRETTEAPKTTKFTSTERQEATAGTQASSESASATEGHVTGHTTHAYAPGTSAATETPLSDEYQTSTTVGTTPMPSTFAAPVTGVYSDWSHWLSCSATCGGGTQERTRKCTFPKETKGAVDCSSLGPRWKLENANALLCPEDGGYTEWSDWSGCDVTCGGGLSQRYRTCNSPAPSFGGRDCAATGLGAAMESKACSLISCPSE